MTAPDAAAFNARVKAMAAFVQARCDEDEQWATEASRDGDRFVSTGAHWQWFTENDEVIEPDPPTMEYVDDDERYASLRSVEHFPHHLNDHPKLRGRVGSDLPMFAIHNAEEVKIAVGGHIIRHDPARALREVAAKRSRVKELLRWAAKADDAGAHPDRYGDGLRGETLGSLMSYMHAVSADAEIWSEHPAYDSTWRVGP